MLHNIKIATASIRVVDGTVKLIMEAVVVVVVADQAFTGKMKTQQKENLKTLGL